MARLCARPGCTAPAAATFTFDGLRRIVWLGPLAEAAAYSAGDLCRRHAELLRPPRNWELRDTRPVPATGERAGAPAPSRYLPPAPVPSTVHPPIRTPARAPAATPAPAPATAPAAPRERPAAHQVARPLLAKPSGGSTLPAASSPLLARAFRSAG